MTNQIQQSEKEDVKLKSTDELIKDFHESRSHNESYNSLVIDVLFERRLKRTNLFEKIATEDLVDIILLNSNKHRDQYLRLVLLELEDRKYDIKLIPEDKKPKNFIPPSKEKSLNNNNKYIGVSIVAVIILVIKLGLMYVRKESNEKQNQVYIANRQDRIVEEEKQKQELNTLIYGENGFIQTNIEQCRHYLDSLKQEYQEFTLSPEIKNDFIESEIKRVEEITISTDINANYINFRSEFIATYRSRLEELLNLY